MIRFDRLEHEAEAMREAFANAQPFAHLVIDDFCDDAPLRSLFDQIPSPAEGQIGKSRDYVFARNKFEKSNFREVGPLFSEIYADLMSDRFKAWLSQVAGVDVWVDPEFHGGGLHQGGAGSFLDMHVDFSHHPLHADWQRDLNVLLYLNPGWQPDWGGELSLRHRQTGVGGKIAPLFNRCVIMRTNDDSLHGYDQLNFPEGAYRRSLATYAYCEAKQTSSGRSTRWYPEHAGPAKRWLGQHWPQLVAIKTRLFGNATSKNR